MLQLKDFQNLVAGNVKGLDLQMTSPPRCANLLPNPSNNVFIADKSNALKWYHLNLRFNYQLIYVFRELALAYRYRSDPIVLSLAHKKINKKKCAKLIKDCHLDHLKATLIWSFYNPSKLPSHVPVLRSLLPAQAHAKNFLAHMLYDAYGFEKESIPAKYRSEHVMGLMMGIRESEDFTRFPIVADALQDTGYEDKAVLDHMRTFPLITLGSGLFRMVGIT